MTRSTARRLEWLLTLFLVTPALASTTASGNAGSFSTADLDNRLETKAKAKGLTPGPLCDDVTFLRRISLDVVGVVPSGEEVDRFLKDTSSDKRAKKVEELLARPEFSMHWEANISGYLMGKPKPGFQANLMTQVRDWMSKQLANNVGYDKLIAQFITAEGPILDNPAVAYVLAKEAVAEDLAGHTAKVLLGAQLQCAQCHNHPFEKWTQKDFYGMMAFWSRTRRAQIPEVTLDMYRKGVPAQVILRLIADARERKKGRGPMRGEQLGRMMRFLSNSGMGMRMKAGDGMGGDEDTLPADKPMPSPEEIMQMAAKAKAEFQRQQQNSRGKPMPKLVPVVFDGIFGEAVIADPDAPPPENPRQLPKGEIVPPQFLDGKAPVYPDRGSRDRRRQLAAWLTAPENPYFAKAAVNRIFSLLTGHGLVEPVDNIVAPSEKALAEELDAFAQAFVQSKFDLRWLVKTVVNSRTYQRALIPAKGSEKDRTYFTHAYARQLNADQLFASLLKASGARGIAGPRFERYKDFILRQFVFTYDTDEGNEVELFHETIPQALMLLNSRFFNVPVQAMRRPAPEPSSGQPMVRVNALYRIASETADAASRIDRLYLATLSRHPEPAETERMVKYLQSHSATEGPRRAKGFFGAPGFLTQGPRGPGRGGDMAMGGEEDEAADEHEAVDADNPPLPASTPNPFASAGERMAYEDLLWSLMSSTEFVYNH